MLVVPTTPQLTAYFDEIVFVPELFYRQTMVDAIAFCNGERSTYKSGRALVTVFFTSSTVAFDSRHAEKRTRVLRLTADSDSSAQTPMR